MRRREDVFLAHGAFFRNWARVGNFIWKVEPLPNVDSTQMRPPCISTICFAMASPRPVPPRVEAVTMFRRVQVRVRSSIGHGPWLGLSALGGVDFAGVQTEAAKSGPPTRQRRRTPLEG